MAGKEAEKQATASDPWHTLGDRLKWAISRQPAEGRRRGVRLFQKRMEERTKALRIGNLGVQSSSIRGYLKGDAEPSRRFLVEAAHVLNVREAWLMCREGEPTEVAEAARRASPAPTDTVFDLPGVVEVFKARLPWEWIGFAGQAQVWNLFTAILTQRAHASEGSRLSDDEIAKWYRDAAETTARAVMAGARAVDAELPLGSWVPASYVVNVCEGLCTLLYSEIDKWRDANIDEEDSL
jgi:transcriptional regulator with XRE-family HTH domain